MGPPEGNIYKWYTSVIYCKLGDYMPPIPPFTGTISTTIDSGMILHSESLALECHPGGGHPSAGENPWKFQRPFLWTPRTRWKKWRFEALKWRFEALKTWVPMISGIYVQFQPDTTKSSHREKKKRFSTTKKFIFQPAILSQFQGGCTFLQIFFKLCRVHKIMVCDSSPP